MASFKFHTNPFSSQVGQRIERATDSNLPSEDWALFIEICDIINDTEDGAKDAIKAIKKRLSYKKDYKSLMYTLTLLEACMKNCGNRFHTLVANKDVLGDLVKILSPKGTTTQVPQIVQEKILMLVQSWSDAFRNSGHLQAFVHCHENLKGQGFEFPAQDMDTLAPIHTPKRTVPESETPMPASRPQNNGNPQTAVLPAQRNNAGPINTTPTQLGKLRSDLNIVEENVRVMNEMLTAIPPEQEESDDIKLLKDLNSTCRQMQQRIIELLGRVANDEVTGELLRINDTLNNVFIRYDRFERNRTGTAPTPAEETTLNTSTNAAVNYPALPTQPGNEPNLLIDFGDSAPASGPVNANTTHEDDEFDMFAQTRSSTFADSRRGGSTYEDNINNVPTESFAGVISKSSTSSPPEEKNIDDDIQDVEEWLKDTDLNKLAPTKPPPYAESTAVTSTDTQQQQQEQQQQQALTSEEFDRFLAERSSAGPERIASTRSNPGAPRQMQMVAGESKEDNLFSL